MNIKRVHILTLALLGVSNLAAMNHGFNQGEKWATPRTVVTYHKVDLDPDPITVQGYNLTENTSWMWPYEREMLREYEEHMAYRRDFSDEEVYCMQQNIFFEARDQNIHGKLGVGFVVLNRSVDPRWPSDLCEVVWDKKHGVQFSWTLDGKPDVPNKKHPMEMRRWEEAGRLARVLTNPEYRPVDVTDGSFFYISTVAARKKRLDQFDRLYAYKTTLDDHKFYE